MMETPFESLWNQFHDQLCRFICSRIPEGEGTSATAEDILQDVFIRIHERLDTVREMDKLESWIYQIARNSIADYYRARRRLVPLNEFEETEFPRETEFPAETVFSEEENIRLVGFAGEDVRKTLLPDIREIVLALPEPYREALILTEYQGLTQKQMAERLGISLSGAKSRVQRARQKVKDILLACCHFEFDARGLVYDYRERCCCCCEEAG
jgi:RNA polymerase sigma-70 factor, ECF subfamily